MLKLNEFRKAAEELVSQLQSDAGSTAVVYATTKSLSDECDLMEERLHYHRAAANHVLKLMAKLTRIISDADKFGYVTGIGVAGGDELGA